MEEDWITSLHEALQSSEGVEFRGYVFRYTSPNTMSVYKGDYCFFSHPCDDEEVWREEFTKRLKRPVENYDFSYRGVSVSPDVAWEKIQQALAAPGKYIDLLPADCNLLYEQAQDELYLGTPYRGFMVGGDTTHRDEWLYLLDTTFTSLHKVEPYLEVFYELESQLPRRYIQALCDSVLLSKVCFTDGYSFHPGMSVQLNGSIVYTREVPAYMRVEDIKSVLSPIVADLTSILTLAPVTDPLLLIKDLAHLHPSIQMCIDAHLDDAYMLLDILEPVQAEVPELTPIIQQLRK